MSGHAAIEAYEVEIIVPGRGARRLVLNAQKLDYDDKVSVCVLLNIMDVTDARASEKLNEELLREKAILMQEIQHRVANSLQIIASLLLQQAKRVLSEETRGHLQDAHDRVILCCCAETTLGSRCDGHRATALHKKAM